MKRALTHADYRRLGLMPGAAADEVKSAFRKLALRYHPDRNPDDADAARSFHEVRVAYEAIVGAGFPSTVGPAQLPDFAQPNGNGQRRHPPPPRQPAAPRQAPRPPATQLVAGMPGGAAVWVKPDALLVAPDRSCFVDPNAASVERVDFSLHLRVVRRADGYHVSIPAGTRHRWPISSRASSAGLAVAAIQVGDGERRGNNIIGQILSRGGRDQRNTAHLPSWMLRDTVRTIPVGGRAWIPLRALLTDGDRSCWIDLNEGVNMEPTMTTPVRVEHQPAGYVVCSDLRPTASIPRRPGPHHAKIIGGTVAGRRVDEPQAKRR